jgi:hypothetical protein
MHRPKLKISQNYMDPTGNICVRGSSEDFYTLRDRHVQAVLQLPGFDDVANLRSCLADANTNYDSGKYVIALKLLNNALGALPGLEPYLFYYIRVCEHVLSIPLTQSELEYEAKVAKYLSLPQWWQKLATPPASTIRCKWCGRYTSAKEPDIPTYGFDASANACGYCSKMYPAPSWLWDSPDGRAYSYYRMSFKERSFYSEFEKDFNPEPLNKISIRKSGIRE